MDIQVNTIVCQKCKAVFDINSTGAKAFRQELCHSCYNKKTTSKEVYLLLYDPDIQDFYFHGIFTLEKAKELVANSYGYMIIEGRTVAKVIFDDYED